MAYLLILMILFTFFLDSAEGEATSHFGGLIAGVFCGFFFSPIYPNPETESKLTEAELSMSKAQRIMFGHGIALYVLMVICVVLAV